MAGLRVALERPEGPRLGEQVVDVVGEERPDRPVYMAGDPRTPFTPLPRGTPSVGGARGGPCIHASVRVGTRARTHGELKRQKGQMRGFTKK